MTTVAQSLSLTGHSVRDGVTWEDYEQILDQIGNRQIRVTFSQGRMEIMSPLPEHEDLKTVLARLIEILAFAIAPPLHGFGSSTLRSEKGQAGLEPDECYYIQNEPKVRGMKRFDLNVYPPPDLAIEIDVFSNSIPREPIYAMLGVPEVWRYNGQRVVVRQLSPDKTYRDISSSLAFPFLPMRQVEGFAQRMLVEEQTSVLQEFAAWVRTLPR